MKPIFERYHEIIPEFTSFQEILHRPVPTHLRINGLKTEAEQTVQSLERQGIVLKRAVEGDDTLYVAEGLDSPGKLLEYFLGHIHPQALTSCLASIALSPEPGASVFDMCAAPGGKTAHLAQLMQNTGLIVANEFFPARHIPLGHTLARLGVLNTIVTGYQAQEFPLKQRFDFILADVPCSGEGRFRKLTPRMRYWVNRKKAKLPDLQKKIIIRGFDLLEDNGKMLYATCTYNPEENESVVDFLLKNRDAKVLPIDSGLDYEPGITEWRNKNYDKQLRRTARFYPHKHDSVGFFMARICKRR
ncbi:MAG: RsmB/NOP family class I SAM-dependent RNA methyltransferase [Desulfobacterales bacterium]|nr:RsmB/NOP family class I SAM-dependent RNA methyltransferase [Desulfobacterales bacterium]